MTWELMQATSDSSPFNWGEFFGSTGPVAGAALLVGYLTKIWIDARKEKREDRKADLEGEVGAVAAAREAVSLVREQMEQMKQDIAVLRAGREEDSRKIDKLEQRVRDLETENEHLKRPRGASG